LFAVYTIPEYRRLRIASKAIEKILNYLRQRGIEKVYLFARPSNYPSMRLFHNAGFEKIGTVSFIKIWKLKILRYKAENKEHYNTLTKMFHLKKTGKSRRALSIVFV